MSLAVYAQYWRINFLTMIEYRANFFMWFGFMLVYHATAIIALWVTLDKFPSMNGWDFKQMAFLYGLWMLGHAFHNTFFFTVGEVPTMVREGRFDRFLVRPLDPLFQALTVPQQIWPDEIVLAIAFFSIATHFVGVRVDAAFLAFVPLVMLGGALIDSRRWHFGSSGSTRCAGSSCRWNRISRAIRSASIHARSPSS